MRKKKGRVRYLGQRLINVNNEGTAGKRSYKRVYKKNKQEKNTPKTSEFEDPITYFPTASLAVSWGGEARGRLR